MSCCEKVKVIYQPAEWQPEGRLLVLDSSFNPPTLAHQALVESTMAHFGREYFCAALLLLTTHNADKGAVSDLDHRLGMMTLLAQRLEELLLLPTAVAVTDFPRFIDKAEALVSAFGSRRRRQQQQQQQQRTTTVPYFIMGYDTLVRFLNPIYYAPTPLVEALGPFFDKAYVVCVDREGYGDMDQFWDDPTSDYRDKITRVRLSDPAVARLSSTLARQQVAASGRDSKEDDAIMVCAPVAEYIRKHGLYRS
ncbi:hypothetical protein BX666DRAFT_2025552 [Dichotomocladium elegans]|nr:hypothetical protein BX666DRAFT_2025552 [Dichotomocladium elegans]